MKNSFSDAVHARGLHPEHDAAHGAAHGASASTEEVPLGNFAPGTEGSPGDMGQPGERWLQRAAQVGTYKLISKCGQEPSSVVQMMGCPPHWSKSPVTWLSTTGGGEPDLGLRDCKPTRNRSSPCQSGVPQTI